MKTLDEIKQLMAVGDAARADEALKELLANEPDNLQAKMLYGTCRQLLGDEETFRRIHDELAPVMERMEEKESKTESVSLWKKYHAIWVKLIIAGLVLAGVFGVAYYGKSIYAQVAAMPYAVYAGPRYSETIQTNRKAEEREEKIIKTSDEDTATVE